MGFYSQWFSFSSYFFILRLGMESVRTSADLLADIISWNEIIHPLLQKASSIPLFLWFSLCLSTHSLFTLHSFLLLFSLFPSPSLYLNLRISFQYANKCTHVICIYIYIYHHSPWSCFWVCGVFILLFINNFYKWFNNFLRNSTIFGSLVAESLKLFPTSCVHSNSN